MAGWIERGGPPLKGLLLKEMVAAAQQFAVDGAQVWGPRRQTGKQM